MGQKVNPIGLRLGITRTWNSRWFAKKNYSKFLHEDIQIRDFLKKELYHAGISRIEIERAADTITVNIRSAKPGIIIGRKGQEVEKIKKKLKEMTDKKIYINIHEVRNPETDAQLVAESIALQIRKRISYRRAMKRALFNAMKSNAKGIKIACAGRLGGAEMARTEEYIKGRVPLHTLRADIDYGFAESFTTYGVIGVKVWIFKGEITSKTYDKKSDVRIITTTPTT